MRKTDFELLQGDRKGVLFAGLCFLHCVAGPVLLAYAGASSLIGISERLEPLFLLSSCLIGLATLIPGYRHRHRRLSCLVVFLCGLFCLVLLRRFQWLPLSDALLTAIGAALIACAHLLNHRFSARCDCCAPLEIRERVANRE